MDSAIPATIGRFKVAGALGKGGMGIVYRALDPSLERAVAIKVLPEAFVSDPEWIARFRREARLLASLNHPNIAMIWSLEEFADGRFLLALELVEGPSLRAKLDEGALPVMEAVRVSAQVAGAVEAAHSRGIIHRDLKPDNIHLTPEGVVKVLDFGLARHEMPPTGPEDSIDQGPRPEANDRRAPAGQDDVTMFVSAAGDVGTVLFGSDESVTVVGDRGEITGTPGYMSPEQVRGHFQDRRSDVFSFGCVLYECLSGQAAFGIVLNSLGMLALNRGETAKARSRFEEALVLQRDLGNRLHVGITVDYTPGACCLAGGGCVLVTQVECSGQSGTWRGPGAPCSPNPCAPPVGACCFRNAFCKILPEARCQSLRGVYRGDATVCSPSICLPSAPRRDDPEAGEVPDPGPRTTSWGKIKTVYR